MSSGIAELRKVGTTTLVISELKARRGCTHKTRRHSYMQSHGDKKAVSPAAGNTANMQRADAT